MEERRKALRLQCILDGTFSKGNIWSKTKTLIIKDISVSGLSFISHSSLKKGEVLSLIIKLDNDSLSCIGEVTRINTVILDRLNKQLRFEIGMKFINLDKASIQKIDAFVKKSK